VRLAIIIILDKYIEDSNVEITFSNGLTRMHIKELLFFKDMELPDYLKLFYEQTNGLMIDSEYLLDDLDDPMHLLINSCENLSFTTKKVNFLPDKRFILFASNDENTTYLLDMKNLDPNSNPLIVMTNPVYKTYIPLTNSVDVFLECACLGVLGLIEMYSEEFTLNYSSIPKRMVEKKNRILRCLKDLFTTAKREYELLDLWQLDPKTKQLVQISVAKWFKEIKRLLTLFKKIG